MLQSRISWFVNCSSQTFQAAFLSGCRFINQLADANEFAYASYLKLFEINDCKDNDLVFAQFAERLDKEGVEIAKSFIRALHQNCHCQECSPTEFKYYCKILRQAKLEDLPLSLWKEYGLEASEYRAHKDTILFLNRVLELEEGDLGMYQALYESYRATGQLEKAIEFENRALEIDAGITLEDEHLYDTVISKPKKHFKVLKALAKKLVGFVEGDDVFTVLFEAKLHDEELVALAIKHKEKRQKKRVYLPESEYCAILDLYRYNQLPIDKAITLVPKKDKFDIYQGKEFLKSINKIGKCYINKSVYTITNEDGAQLKAIIRE